jgi:two-component system LytT family sensor kinase
LTDRHAGRITIGIARTDRTVSADLSRSQPELAPPSWRWPSVRVAPALQLLGLFGAVGLVQGSAVHIGLLAQGSPLPGYAPFVWHVTGAITAWMAMPVVQVAALNARSPGVGWPRFVGIQVAGYLAFTVVHVSLLISVQGVLGLAFGLAVPREPLASRALWEAQNDVVVYSGLVVLWILFHVRDEKRAAALRAARLEAQAAQARLEALTGQLDPHFMLNALNTISEVMYEDLARTERLLASLGDLLRATLSRGAASWSLGEERAHAERYVELLEARFPDRFSVRWQVASGLDAASVPRYAIQSLVENAVKHNRAQLERLTVTIEVAPVVPGASGERPELVRVAVSDTGQGFAHDPVAADRSLRRLKEVLELVYGEAARLECTSDPSGGARVALAVPYCRAETAA